MPRDFAVLADDDEDRGNDKDTEDMLRDDLTDGGEILTTLTIKARSRYTAEQSRALSIQRIAFYIKLICTLDLFFSIYSTKDGGHALWLMGSGGFLFNPLGFYGAHKYKRRLILLYAVYLVVDTIFQFAYVFTLIGSKQALLPVAVLLSLFFVVCKGYLVFYVFQFYRILPTQGGWWSANTFSNNMELSDRSDS